MSIIQSMKSNAVGERALSDMLMQISNLPRSVNQQIGKSITEGLSNATQIINARISAGLGADAKFRQTLGGAGGFTDAVISFFIDNIQVPSTDLVKNLISLGLQAAQIATAKEKLNAICKQAAEDYKSMAAQIGMHGSNSNDNDNAHFNGNVVLYGAVGAVAWRDAIMPRYRYFPNFGAVGTARRI